METNHQPMFTGKEIGIELTLDEAKKKVKKFNINRKKEDIKAHYFSRVVLEKLLSDKENIMGIRVYYGMNEKADLDAVIVGVNEAGNNVFTGEFSERGAKDVGSDNGGIYASAYPCPNRCGSNSFA